MNERFTNNNNNNNIFIYTRFASNIYKVSNWKSKSARTPDEVKTNESGVPFTVLWKCISGPKKKVIKDY